MSTPDTHPAPSGDGIDRVIFVLDRPQDIGNVGAVVRLMGNFGLGRLRLVEPCAFDPERILTIARRGHRVLAATERVPSLDVALVDCGLVLGATRRSRAVQRVVLTPRQAAPLLLAAGAGVAQEVALLQEQEHQPGHAPVPGLLSGDAPFAAVLFGPEDFGLANTALDRCHAILQIPTASGDASLNLAQAVLVVAYELFLHSGRAEPDDPRADAFAAALAGLAVPARAAVPGAFAGDDARAHDNHTAGAGLASGAALEEMYAALGDLLRALHPDGIEGRTNAALERLRSLFARAVPRSDEVRLLSQVLAHAARVARAADRQSRHDP